ncbi:hypothetical protein IEQ34_018260 [Dendrobium chrysotoxum]|uniref:Uncharacterized protein n=1 Tax=Dendrobium chrysotoxum TaxID=161865 RepID=A0AAV7GCH6_DENCH|nr:hypothetical protein IEQ34_018260 [Dendrobium chrysotoxum]
MESRFGGMKEMMRKLIEIQSKTPPAVSSANPHHDLIEIPLAESKGKKIVLEEFDEENSFHQEPPPRAPIRGRIRVFLLIAHYVELDLCLFPFFVSPRFLPGAVSRGWFLPFLGWLFRFPLWLLVPVPCAAPSIPPDASKN